MKRGFSTAFLAIVVGLVLVSSAAGASSTKPDAVLTPGSTSATVNQTTIKTTICADSQGAINASAGPTTKVFVRYGIAKRKRSAYVVDQLIPARLGGSNVVENLWPEKRAEAESKDAVEARLHDLVCSGQVDLAAAQQAIAADWSSAQAAMETAAATRKQGVAQYIAAVKAAEKQAAVDYVASVQAAEKQRQLEQFVRSLPPPTTQPAQPAPSNCPNGTYVNSAGNTVCSPSQSSGGAPAGATARCGDGTYSFSQSRSGTCSSHGGVAQWL
jgi:Protein of unknown function (DUF3761)